MQKIQDVFNRIEETKRKRKEINKIYKEALENTGEYKKIVEQIQALRESKKQIEASVQVDFRSEFGKLDQIKLD